MPLSLRKNVRREEFTPLDVFPVRRGRFEQIEHGRGQGLFEHPVCVLRVRRVPLLLLRLDRAKHQLVREDVPHDLVPVALALVVILPHAKVHDEVHERLSVHGHVSHRRAHRLQRLEKRSAREWPRDRTYFLQTENRRPVREPVVRDGGEVAALEHGRDDARGIGIDEMFCDGKEDGR